MKRNRRPARLALLAALVLMLALPAGCAGEQSGAEQPSDGGAVSATQEPGPALSADKAAETPATAEPESPAAESAAPEEPTQEAVKPEEIAQSAPPQETPAPENTKPAETTPAASEEPAPAETSLQDGTYTVAVTLSGGSGKAKVASPAALRVENGVAYATITWSSSNYDYMKVNGEKYLPLTMEGGSVFEIPVAGFDCDLPVVADTVAMSTPHEIEYTLRFDSATIQSAS